MLHALGISMGVERYAETITTKYANNTEAPDPLKKLTEWPSDADALWLAAHENIAICIPHRVQSTSVIESRWLCQLLVRKQI